MKGRRIGPYLIEGLLGSGGIGHVYAALDEDLGRRVALKALRSEYSQDPDLLERFRNEAASLARLNHTNITMLYSLMRPAEAEQQSIYMVMEIVNGETLEALLRRLGRISIAGCRAVMAQAAVGLSYAHAAGIVHRDIKPSNLMLDTDGLLKITDFGIARVQGSQRLTRHGTLVGTLSYIAPEQIKGHEADERSDLYSLACVLYEMLSGEKPFSGATEYELIRAHLEAEPRPLIETRPELEPELAKAIARALAKEPDKRFASLAEFARAIDATVTAESARMAVRNEILAPAAAMPDPPNGRRGKQPAEPSVTAFAAPLPPEPPPAEPAPQRKRGSRRGLIAALCAALVLCLGGGALVWETRHPASASRAAPDVPKLASVTGAPPPPAPPPPAPPAQTPPGLDASPPQPPPAPPQPAAAPEPPPQAGPTDTASALPDASKPAPAQLEATPDPAPPERSAAPPETASETAPDTVPTDQKPAESGTLPDRVLSGTVSSYSPEGWPELGGVTVHLDGIGPLAVAAAKPIAGWIAAHGNYLACTQVVSRAYRCLTHQNLDLAEAILLNGAARTSRDAQPLYREAEARARVAKRGLWR